MTKEEALKIVRENYPHFGTTEPWLDLEKALATLIPELAESEDEWVPKELIEYLKQKSDYRSCWITWLEKQKEQKPVPINPDDKHMLERIMELVEFCNDKETIWNWLCEKVKEQKPAEKQDYSGLNDLERAILRGFLSAGVENVTGTIIKETAKECLAQMKPVEWSEEDEEMLVRLLDSISIGNDYEEMRNWLLLKLKSLLLQGSKDSLQTHWKPSEDDKQYFDNLVVMFEKSLRDNRCYFTSYDVDWLKSKFNGNSCK